MNELKAEVTKMVAVNAADLEDFVEASYGISWSFVAAEECDNDSQHTFRVTGRMSDYDMGQLTKWLDADGMGAPDLRALVMLNSLAARRLIDTGEYIVKVCW